MRHAFGKPQGTVARVKIGQILMSVRVKDGNLRNAEEALRRASMKFPGQQKIVVSKKWGFTKYTVEEYNKLNEQGRIKPTGNIAYYLRNHGPLGY